MIPLHIKCLRLLMTSDLMTTNLQLDISLFPKTHWAVHFSRKLHHLYIFQIQKSTSHPSLLSLTHLQSVRDIRDTTSLTSLASIHFLPAFFQALITSCLIIITSLWKTVQLSSIQPPHCQHNHPKNSNSWRILLFWIFIAFKIVNNLRLVQNSLMICLIFFQLSTWT